MLKILSVKYYQKNKERLQRKLAKDIKIFLKKKKEKREKREYGRERYRNLSEDEKHVEYRKNIIE